MYINKKNFWNSKRFIVYSTLCFLSSAIYLFTIPLHAQYSSIETTFPTRAQSNLEQNITDLSYWLDVLPYEEDKGAEGYIVYPKQWVIAPLVWPDADDIEKIKVGELFDHYKYLQNGALHYVWTAPDQGIGNMVVAAHSSFAKSDPGRYKTIFQWLISTSIGDKIFIYLQNEEWNYDTYIYTVEESKKIAETDVSILDQHVSQKTLTTFTCYPIWTTDARWKNVAVLTDTILASDKQTHGSAPEEKTTTGTDTFITQSLVKKNTVSSYNITKNSSSVKTTEQKPTHTTSWLTIPLLLRVKYRPLAYKSTLQLLAKSGFKKTTLTKLITILDEKKSALSTTDLAWKKSYIHYSLMQDIIRNFMQ